MNRFMLYLYKNLLSQFCLLLRSEKLFVLAVNQCGTSLRRPLVRLFSMEQPHLLNTSLHQA